LLGRIPSAVGYQPTLSTDMGGMQERLVLAVLAALYIPFLSDACLVFSLELQLHGKDRLPRYRLSTCPPMI
jgi:hypothetical protein